MPGILDVFQGSAFNVMTLTAAINKIPYSPGRLGRLGLFKPQSITTTVATIEEKHGKLSLLNTGARGARNLAMTQSRAGRQQRAFVIPHVPQRDALLADSLQNVRAFGRETETEVFATVLNDKLEVLRANHEVTHEWHRMGAIKGIILDGDGTSVIYDLFAEFGITPLTVSFDFTDVGTFDDANPTQDMKAKALEVIRTMQAQLGGTPLNGVMAFCGDNFFDNLTGHATVRRAWERQQDMAAGAGSMNQFARNQQAGFDTVRETGFEYAGIRWENYRGTIGSQAFIDSDECRFFPLNTPDVFTEIAAPADYVETVNTLGRPIYAKQERMEFDKGVDIETQSNVLMMCQRPAVLIQGTDDTPTTTT